MIKTIIVRSIMFISSYFPLYILLLISQGNDILQTPNWYFVGFIAALLIISLLSIIFLKNAPIGNYCKPINVFTYIIPLLGFSFNNFYSVVVNIVLFFMIWFLYIKLDLIFINPLWSLVGYISYEFNEGYIITNIRYEDIIRTNKPLKGCYLTNRIFLAHKSNFYR